MKNPDPAPAPGHAGAEGPDDEAERLRRELQERDDLMAMAAHELRNPLHALSLQLALLRTLADQHGQADIGERVAKAQATLARYTDRVTVLLDLVRLQADAYPLALQSIDLAAFVHAVAESLEGEARFRGVALQVIAPPACRVLTDPLVVEQVLDNLLLNAFKHAACSTVTLELRCIEGDAVELAVGDDGRGIALEDQARVFAKFGIGPAASRGSGSGLGLWIVRKLVQVLGGSIAVRSEAGAGCLFTLRIPMTHRSGQEA